MPPRLLRVVGVLAALLLAACCVIAPAAAATERAAPQVQVNVLSVTPSSAPISTTPKPLAVELLVTNQTAKSIKKLVIEGVRGDPIAAQQELDKSLARATWPNDGLAITTEQPVTVDVAAHATTTVSFRTTTDVVDHHGICVCGQFVYPLFFGAFDPAGGARLGFARTYLPAFYPKPIPVRVAWVWPLIDRPHRTTSELVFTDDDLASEVAPGGRLDNSLQVLERVGAKGVPITILADPDLLDELEVMSTNHYTVQPVAGAAGRVGTGTSDAAAWLGRFRALVTNHPNVQVQLTPYADPDVQTLSQRHLTWSPRLGGAGMADRVEDALPDRALDFDTAWPAASTLSPETVQQLHSEGVHTLLLDDSAVHQQSTSSVPTALARLGTAKSPIAVGLLSGALQKYATAALTNAGGTGLSQLPNLVAEIAVRAAQQPDVEHAAVLAAPRSIDPDPDTAYRTIMDTSSASYIVASSLATVTAASGLPTTRATLTKVPDATVQLPESIIETADDATTSVPTLNSLLDSDPTARVDVLPYFPLGVQRSVSSAWRTQRATGVARAAQLSSTFATLLAGVHIVQRNNKSGSYTLGSKNSKLPITVQNDLAYRVRVRVSVQTVNDVPGFDVPEDIAAQAVQPRSQSTVQLPTEVSRTGRFAVVAQLLTPNSQPVGESVNLTVHSTALGVVGVVITIVAGAVLLVALVVRFARRFRKREARPPATGSVPAAAGGPDPVDTGADQLAR